MNSSKEQWVQDVLDSADLLNRADARAVQDKVLDRLCRRESKSAKTGWVEEVLNSHALIRRAEVPASLLEKVLNGKRPATVSALKPPLDIVWKMAAVLLLLVAVNISTLYIFKNHSLRQSRQRGLPEAPAWFDGERPGSTDVGNLIFGN